ncbi:type I-C CRISPR-associated protein Cas5c [Marinithermus hydrothermalis]|uniref:pre-crRNA processing endonuclease n=1 Tax=Marinithermus hydrothermalis (strain DSM 14884 / JCM 11576 / T1) TaxID=869210 RepID=F2NNM1_MARHT|nr:type I-C CRISPR-associated protein Cas5c [Marinithermus hydrothermalis]AEB11036.1 CRISPR-associated protein Cas5 family [Marinithermus hydrothermalis DSM 14884]
MERVGRVSIRVWGEYALFSRPEFKVERVSYPVITPSAARGVLEAIFWKPEIRYQIRRIGVLKPGRQVAILRNEIASRQGRTPIIVEHDRQQRTSLVLKDVAYLIEAEIHLRSHATEPVFKYTDQFRRRVERGQYHHTPYLGTREFTAFFAPMNGEAPPALDLEIGTMLFDIAFVEDNKRKELSFKRPGKTKPVKGYAQPLFFEARVENGWLEVPQALYRELRRLEGEDV